MKRLRTDYIDLYYLHRTNKLVPLSEIAEVMVRLIEEELICEWGMSHVCIEADT